MAAELADADSDILIIRLRLLGFMPNNAALKLEKARPLIASEWVSRAQLPSQRSAFCDYHVCKGFLS